MKIIVILLLVCAPALSAAGQDPAPAKDCAKAKRGDPVCYAQEIKAMLNEYTKRLSTSVKRKRAAYARTAHQFDRDMRSQVDSRLALARSREGEEFTRDLLAGRAPAAEWSRRVADYAIRDFNANRQLLRSDLETGSAQGFVSSLEDLIFQVDNVKKLSDLVDLLAKPRSLKDELDQVLAFGKEIKDQYKKAACDEVTGQRDAAKKAKDGKEASIKVATDPAEVATLTAELGQLAAKLTALDEYLAAKSCTNAGSTTGE